ncbi:hypothetical protein [Halostreptopolyspora alba]|uniref:DUF3558 domain-containing protein n=1 Tax=Halostreptopolyspora alba TaxID=2487137 RepID=A0A3N0E422_9ACTN|nr:hypothetical protein EFW17_19050 [Nocardiopsaceae bacterium YIM 96095]
MSVRTASGPLVLGLTLLVACSGQTDFTPGIAHPAASASDGHVLNEGDTLHNYNDINVALPSGWQARVSGDCLTPPGIDASRGEGTDSGCPAGALRIRMDAAEGGYIDREGRRLDDADGWWRPDTRCSSSGGTRTLPASARSAERDTFTVVSGERVEAGEWVLTCPDGSEMRTRIWYVPEADVEFGVSAMASDVSRDEYERVVRSLDLSRYVD